MEIIKYYKCSDIRWDTDGEPADLPDEIIVPLFKEDIEDIGEDSDVAQLDIHADDIDCIICDRLSDNFGFCICDFTIEEIDPNDPANLEDVTHVKVYRGDNGKTFELKTDAVLNKATMQVTDKETADNDAFMIWQYAKPKAGNVYEIQSKDKIPLEECLTTAWL